MCSCAFHFERLAQRAHNCTAKFKPREYKETLLQVRYPHDSNKMKRILNWMKGSRHKKMQKREKVSRKKHQRFSSSASFEMRPPPAAFSVWHLLFFPWLPGNHQVHVQHNLHDSQLSIPTVTHHHPSCVPHLSASHSCCVCVHVSVQYECDHFNWLK